MADYNKNGQQQQQPSYPTQFPPGYSVGPPQQQLPPYMPNPNYGNFQQTVPGAPPSYDAAMQTHVYPPNPHPQQYPNYNYYAAPPQGYPGAYHQQQQQHVVMPIPAGTFDAGARFGGNGGGMVHVPPPPPGCFPTAAQAAAASGTPVVMSKKKNNFLSGGHGGGYTFW